MKMTSEQLEEREEAAGRNATSDVGVRAVVRMFHAVIWRTRFVAMLKQTQATAGAWAAFCEVWPLIALDSWQRGRIDAGARSSDIGPTGIVKP
jgi:hypothetical protein